VVVSCTTAQEEGRGGGRREEAYIGASNKVTF